MESNATVEEASNKANDLVELFARGGFKVTEFVSKVSQLATELKPWGIELTWNRQKSIPGADECSNVLKLKWNHASDTLVVN